MIIKTHSYVTYASFLSCLLILVTCYQIILKRIDENMHSNLASLCTVLPSSLMFADSARLNKWTGSTMYWPRKSVIKVYFMNGSLDAKRKVLSTAKVWEVLSNLTFQHVLNKNSPSDIRISFKCPGYNSLVGTQNLDPRYKEIPTMCLFGLDTIRDQAIYKRTVLHEFGHVMGMLHELQNPSAVIPWDTAKLYDYYKDTYHWKPDSVDKWVLKKYTTTDHSLFDSKSIMLYVVPKSLTKGDYAIPWPVALSKKDEEFIKLKYK